MTRILRIDTGPVTPLDDPVVADKLRSGTPMTGHRAAHHDEARGFYTGIWESSPGAWSIHYTEEESCVLLAGHVRLTGDDGTVEEFRAGDVFYIPRGYKGIWETIEPARKVYTILL